MNYPNEIKIGRRKYKFLEADNLDFGCWYEHIKTGERQYISIMDMVKAKHGRLNRNIKVIK